MRLTSYCLLMGVLTPLLTMPARALAWDGEEDDDRGRKLAEMQLIRTADLVADPLSLIPFPWGNDTLDAGRVEVRARRLLVVEMHGVPAAAAFRVQYCGLVNSPARCSDLGEIRSDDEGHASGVVPFPAAGNPWAGFFTVVRDGKTMFVSGFAFPPMPPMGGAAVSVEGRVASVDVPGMKFTVTGFTPVVRVDAETRFTGNLQLSDLQAGAEVEVEGATQGDGSVLASRVKVKREKHE